MVLFHVSEKLFRFPLSCPPQADAAAIAMLDFPEFGVADELNHRRIPTNQFA